MDTVENLETGLRGIPVGYCTTSHVEPEKGLFYVEHFVPEMAAWQPEQVLYLLSHGRKGSDDEVKAFSSQLAERAQCSDATLQHIRTLPREGHPMKLLSAALLICGMIEGKNDYREDCLNVIAKIPQLVAAVINHHAGWEPLQPSRPALGYMENFTQMLNVPNADLEALTRVFKLFNIMHYDHGGGNLSVFVGKAIASGLEDMYGSLSGAMCALAGPRHGKANQDCLAFVKELQQQLGENPSEEQLEEHLRRRLANHELVFGFGHAVLRVEDPRATVFYRIAQEQFPDDPLVRLTALLRTVGPRVLGENRKIADPFPNIDAISGTLLSASGFPYPAYFTTLFGLSRCVGIALQIVYERCEARDGKGTPIVRPKYLYKRR